MSKPETPEAINDQAAAWMARIDSAGLDPAMQTELDHWLAGDSRRRGAFFRAQVAWQALDRASALNMGGPSGTDARQAAMADREPLERQGGSRRRFFMGGGAIAASLLVGLVSYTLWRDAPDHVETALGEIRHLPLQDGSFAAVNTSTKLAIDLRPDIRNIRIDKGEAWFKVAKDRSRPFVVEIGDVRVRAVGTAFSVKMLGSGADVQVTEGVVEVWTVGNKAEHKRASAGTRTFVSYTDGPATPVEDKDINRTLSWRSGELLFEGDTLFEAAAELNRYNAMKLSIDPVLAGEKIVGRFRANEPEAFAQAAASMFNGQVRTGQDSISVSPK